MRFTTVRKSMLESGAPASTRSQYGNVPPPAKISMSAVVIVSTPRTTSTLEQHVLIRERFDGTAVSAIGLCHSIASYASASDSGRVAPHVCPTEAFFRARPTRSCPDDIAMLRLPQSSTAGRERRR